jgi:hypothetical protein
MAPSPGEVNIFFPLVVGAGTTFGTVVIHAFALVTIIHFFRHERRLGRTGVRFGTDVMIVAATVLLALAAHLVVIAVWALVFTLCGEFPHHFAAAFYHSAVNYTSLGYGDIVMSASWKLLGPMETADGMLLFGVSTAMIFTIRLRLIHARLGDSSVKT